MKGSSFPMRAESADHIDSVLLATLREYEVLC